MTLLSRMLRSTTLLRPSMSSRFMSTEVKNLWKNSQAVCFDVDSTVITSEGIDVLAAHCGAGEAVAEWTRKAMGGDVPFHVALEERLNLFKPSLQDFQDCHKIHPLHLTPGVEQLVQKLHERGVHVYLVSGGFRQMINPIAEILKIDQSRIYANNIFFNEDGTYAGFDEKEPTSRAHGKANVVKMLKETHKYSPLTMVGDGATDMEAKPPADIFVGFGGVVVRDVVRDNADWFVTDMKEMINALD